MKRRAHITPDGREQLVSEHLHNVAELTKEYMGKIECFHLGYLTGLLHDMGKGTEAFDGYIVKVSAGETWSSGKLNHSAAGARYLTELLWKKEMSLYERLTLQLVCEAILCHHSGLCDNYTKSGEDGYKKRIYTEKDIYYPETVSYLCEQVSNEQKIRELFEGAVTEVKTILGKKNNEGAGESDVYYACGLLMKVLFSCLIDADRYDTAMFMQSQIVKEQNDNQELWDVFISKIDSAIDALSQSAPINRARKKISDICRQAAEFESGVYTLNCPTGSGKTYSSIRYALHHAKQKQKRQIFYIIPFQSIIDQNADAIREILGNDDLTDKSIVELHSNVVFDNKEEDYKLLTERMDAPIVLTTMVRFLNTFFGSGTQNIRPIHQFQNAVIIFDEIQTLPIRCVRMFNGLINFLSQVCGSTCILCSATQPLLDRSYEDVKPIRFQEPKDIVVLDDSIQEVFSRVIPMDARTEHGYTVESLAEFTISKAGQEGDCLVVMNTKSSALRLFQEIQNQSEDIQEGEPFELFFLSTKLCPAHRRTVVEQIRKNLDKAPMIVVSTQLIEAGVDLSFGCAIRAIAGLDSWVQTAGRCNRNGKWNKKNTYIVNPDFERLSYLPDIKLGSDCTRQVLDEYKSNPKEFDCDLFSEKAVKRYFEIYLYRQNGKMSYSLTGELKGSTLFGLLAKNEGYKIEAMEELGEKFEDYIVGQAFKTAGIEFEAIEQTGKSVLVPWRQGRDLIADLVSAKGVWKKKELLRKAQQYAVNLTEQELKCLEGVVLFSENAGVYMLNDLYYDELMGVTMQAAADNKLCTF